MRAWAWHDYEAMLLWGSKRAGARHLVLVAHAFGGQALGLAASAGLPVDRVGVKATTNEGSDDIGRGLAVAAHAVALLSRS